MPSPIQILLDPVSLTVLSLFAGLLVFERLAPARSLPEVRGWNLRCLASFVTYFFLSSYLPLLWDAKLAQHRLFDLSGLGVLGGTLLVLGVYEAGVYLWHRAMHGSNMLFRVFHQMHHSAERVDVAGAFYFSLTDMIGWTALGSLSLALLVGVSPQANTAFLLVSTFLGMFQHANVRTPRWLGYFIQRPESHSVHHARDIHAYNYSDLPIFDLLFGTFRNPADFAEEAGFYDGASARIGEMLIFRDVSKPPEEHGSRRSTKRNGPPYRRPISGNHC